MYPDPESGTHFRDSVIALAQSKGWVVYQAGDGSAAPTGYPDLALAHLDRGVILVGFANAAGETEMRQRFWSHSLHCEAALVYLWGPADMREILATLDPSACNCEICTPVAGCEVCATRGRAWCIRHAVPVDVDDDGRAIHGP